MKYRPPLIEIQDLRLAYAGANPSAPAVGPVSFEIEKGEALGLIGESGAGKSTIGLEILGLLRLKSGRRTGGEIRSHLDPAHMAYIPQDPAAALDPLFSIGHQLREIGGAGCDQEISMALRKVHLSQAKMSLKSYPHELSGGMKQRLVIAMALLKRPKLIVADEPTSSLDVILQHEIMDLFREIRTSGITFLFITHNLPLAAKLCDRIAILRRGRLVEIGEPQELYEKPKQNYTRELMSAVPKVQL